MGFTYSFGKSRIVQQKDRFGVFVQFLAKIGQRGVERSIIGHIFASVQFYG